MPRSIVALRVKGALSGLGAADADDEALASMMMMVVVDG
jgi:hypothetical protein